MKTNMGKAQKYFKEYQDRLNGFSDEQLISAFNIEVDNKGWGTARGSYLVAIHKEFIKRNLDFSLIGNLDELSFKYKIFIKDRKIFLNE
jgi:hypothetical protein